MKVLTNTRASNEKDMVVYFDSNDYDREWHKTTNIPMQMQIDEWRNLLKTFSNSDVMYYPHDWETTYKTEEIRNINIKFKNNRHIIFHAFSWRYVDIIDNLQLLKTQGFTHIMVAPVQGTKSGNEWWEFFQPLKIGFVDNPRGTKKEFKELCEKANEIGIYIGVDIVLRHVADSCNDRMKLHEKVDKSLEKYVLWDKLKCENYKNRWDYTNLRLDAPMMNIWDREYQDICINFIKELRMLGVKFLRLDQLKHYPVSSEGCDFLKNVFEQFEKDMLIFGEVIYCPVWENDLYINNY